MHLCRSTPSKMLCMTVGDLRRKLERPGEVHAPQNTYLPRKAVMRWNYVLQRNLEYSVLSEEYLLETNRRVYFLVIMLHMFLYQELR